MNPKYLDFVSVFKRAYYKCLSPLIKQYVRHFTGARIGVDANFNGMPLILVRQGGSLLIGDRFCANSSEFSNAVGLPHATMIAVQGEGASIIIGDNVGVSGVSINCRCSIEIGDNVMIGGGVGIWDNDFHPLNAEVRRTDPVAQVKSKAIIIEEDVFIGARAIILKGVTIGKRSVIGAGAVVTKSVPADSIAVGNPAAILNR